MNKLRFLLMAWICQSGIAWAQQITPGTPYPPIGPSNFDLYNSRMMRHQFTIALEKSNYIKIEVADKEGLNYLANIDSLISVCASRLQPLKDSLNNELNGVSIDYLPNKKGNDRIRLQHNSSTAADYAFQDGELVAVKTQQDTLKINGHYTSSTPVAWSKKNPRYLMMPYRVTIVLNNINDLPGLQQRLLNKQVQKISNDWERYLNKGKTDKWGTNLTAYYNLQDSSLNSVVGNFNRLYKRSNNLLPYIGFTLQNMQNYFTPSVQLGADLSRLNSKEQGEHYILYLEKFFFRQQDVGGKSKMLVNNFITFQFRKIDIEEKPVASKLDFNMQFSLGYLITRSGNYFEKNSFHLCVPGLAYRNLQLTPGLFFNNLFNQTSPTLSLTLYLE